MTTCFKKKIKIKNGEQGDFSSWKWFVATKVWRGGGAGRPHQREEKLLQTPPCRTAARGKLPESRKIKWDFLIQPQDRAPRGQDPGWGRGRAGAMVGGGGRDRCGAARATHTCFEIISGGAPRGTDTRPASQSLPLQRFSWWLLQPKLSPGERCLRHSVQCVPPPPHPQKSAILPPKLFF